MDGTTFAGGVMTRLETMDDVITQNVAIRPDAVALIADGREFTYGAMHENADRAARALVAAGVKPGDRIGYLARSLPEFWDLLFGATRIGAVLAPINYRLAPPEVAAVAADAGASLLFAESMFDEAAKAADGVRIIHFDKPDYAAFLKAGDEATVDHRPQAADEVIQLYTSGTTGVPKGVVLRHDCFAGLLQLGDGGFDDFQWTPGELSLTCVPLFHIAGVGWSMISWFRGQKLVMHAGFEPEQVLSDIETMKIARGMFVPAMLLFLGLTEKAKTADLSSVQHIHYGASPISPDLLRGAMQLFGNADFGQHYGMTELTGSITYLTADDHKDPDSPRLKSAGRPLPHCEIIVADPDGKELPPGEVGEVRVRSGAMMSGYWRRKDATDEAIRGGWYCSGDAAYTDEDGYIFIVDRIKDMIVTGGENVYPAEVEKALAGMEGIADVAVIGVPHDTWGESVKAIVVTAPGAQLDEAAVLAFAKTQVAGFKVPRSVDFIDALPRNASGKILRRDLRKPYWEGRERAVG
ncbi:MAG: long-chain-fatty-acid--CoA ligase [Pseudomonadota bacterium]